MSLNIEKVKEFSNKAWDENILPTLSKYIEIPNQSPLYDAEWATNGYTEEAIQLLEKWILAQGIKGISCEIKRIEGLTPIIFMVVEATKTEKVKTVLLYGHMDKQPPLTDAWDEGLHPYKAVIKNNKLYGRGGADDGYSTFASISAIKALQEQSIPHDRYVIIIEGSEESGSIHLPQYVEKFQAEIQIPSLVVCLDSGCGNYDQLWMTSSLRGVLTGDLTVKVLNEACHSGSASGIVPSSFRILRQVLDRAENQLTGEVDKRLHVEIPQHRLDQIAKCAEILGETIYDEFSWYKNTTPVTKDLTQLMINKTWYPTICITGAEGIPHTSNAGNVMRTHTTVKVSVRLPPSFKAADASTVLKEIFETNPPYGAEVTFKMDKCASGWDSPQTRPELEKALGEASNLFFGKDHVYMGEGGSIPFMKMLHDRFNCQFIVTGLLGPGSNAHGPNEFLDIPFAKKLLSCVIYLLDAHSKFD